MAFFRAAMASFKAERLAPGLLAPFPGDAKAFWAELGFDGSFSRRLRDFASRVEDMLPGVSELLTLYRRHNQGNIRISLRGPHSMEGPESAACSFPYTRIGIA